jgi:flagella synthesis protein FlgN
MRSAQRGGQSNEPWTRAGGHRARHRGGWPRVRRAAHALEEQFAAALRHDAAATAAIAGRITTLVGEIEARRQDRVTVCSTLVGPGAGVQAILPLLPEASRMALAGAWTELEARVLECKRLNARNGRLMTDQHLIMQRVLHGDADTYVPA